MGAIWYASVEEVKATSDSQMTARDDALVRRCLASASDTIHDLTKRFFYPLTGTKYADWPNGQYAVPERIWLDDDNDVISLSSLTSGGVAIAAGTYNLEPANSGPPYEWIEMQLDGPSSLSGGSTHQRSLVMVGVFGYRADEVAVGALSAAMADAVTTTCAVTDSSNIGTGHILRVGSERMIVTARGQVASGQTVLADMAASLAAVTVSVTSGAALFVGEEILVDAERMLIVDIAGNSLIVRRAWNGSVLATHATTAAIYVPRTLTVTRGALGTTAASHIIGSAVARHDPPAMINELAVAETQVAMQQFGSAWARTVGSGEGERESRGAALADLRRQVVSRFGRGIRTSAV